MKRPCAILVSFILSVVIVYHGYASGTETKVDSVAIINDSIDAECSLNEVAVSARHSGTARLGGAENGMKIGREELFRAACCNLGESFVTNPSVDVSYNDATTGARQIRLLGLAGTYVQMLTENLPNFRGAAAPYALGYVPGTWMKGIQVSKGASSVKNGYESITGQINIDYLQPEDEQGVEINLFGDTKNRVEANVEGNLHVNKRLNTELLMHYENSTKNHDDNGDGFYDKPKVEQLNVQNRWMYSDGTYIFHGGAAALKESRKGGQMEHSATHGEPFGISLDTERYEAYMKHAFILNKMSGANIAFMAFGSMHRLDAKYGYKAYNVNEKNAYTSLMFETNFTKMHNISVGLSLNHDYLGQRSRLENDPKAAMTRGNEKETTTGAYVQYTLDLSHKLTAMAGIRADHSSVYGTFITPRFHLKYMPNDIFTVRLSAGKGYRTVHALAENNYLLASGRHILIDDLKQETAWNYGASTALNIPIGNKTLKLNVEYYYTHFLRQAVIDYDSDPSVIHIANLAGRSYSHTFQVDASYPLFKGMTLTAAYRLSDVKTSYGGKIMERPLTSKYKGLLTASYKTPLGLWQFDATLQLNGSGRLPTAHTQAGGTSAWSGRFHSYEQLSAQVTRWFRHFSVYVGGENLTDFTQKTTIFGADNPWGEDFEPTLVWGPVHGRMFYAGIRVNLFKM